LVIHVCKILVVIIIKIVQQTYWQVILEIGKRRPMTGNVGKRLEKTGNVGERQETSGNVGKLFLIIRYSVI